MTQPGGDNGANAGRLGSAVWRRRHLTYLWDFLVGATVALVFTVLGVWFAEMSWGRALERYTHDFLQLQIAYFRPPSELPIVVLDIHDWYDEKKKETPRPELQALVGALARAHPRAIGIDVDFSPAAEGFISEQDPDFFGFCQSLKTSPAFGIEPVSVFLGVGRRAGGPSFQWLGDPDYTELAASIILPKNPWRIPQSITSKTAAGEVSELPSMSFALANAADAKTVARLSERTWLTEAIVAKPLSDAQEVRALEFLMDSSTVAQLEQSTIPLGRGPVASGVLRRVRDKVVLIGDPELGGSDAFPVAGEQRQAAGVYVHAAAAATLLDEPFKTFTTLGRHVFDLGVTLVTMTIVIVVRWWDDQPLNIRLEKALTWAVCVGVVVFAAFFVAWTRILWLDFVIVIASNVVHGPAKERSDSLLRRLPAYWRQLKEPDHV